MLVCMTRELIDERRRNWPGDLGGQRVGQTWRRLRGWLGEVLADLLALLWPCACLMCGAPNRQLCPDCRADLTLDKDASGIYVLVIAHDLTCPWMTARERSLWRECL